VIAERPLVAPSVSIRAIRVSDVDACGLAGFEAHTAVARAHNVPPEQPSLEFATGLIRAKMADANARGFVAEWRGQVIGSVFLTTFPPGDIAAIGPLTVRPSARGGVGHRLLEAVLAEARRLGVASVRLVQSPSHLRSLALYTSMGFEPREPLVLVNGPAPAARVAGSTVRDALESDVAECNRISQHVLGFARDHQLRAAVAASKAFVIQREDRIFGYTAGLGFGGHAVASETPDLQVLIARSPEIHGPGFFVPIRNGALLRWLLEQRFRMIWPALLMTIGAYDEPRGAFLPAISF